MILLKALQSIVDSISAAFQFLLNMIKGLIQLVTLLPKALSFVHSCTTYLPTFIVAFALAGITISIVFMVVGRSGGGSDG